MSENGKMTPRQQGDLGELSAMIWLTQQGASVFRPVLHTPDVDLIADVAGGLIRSRSRRQTSAIRTAGGPS